MRRKPHILSKNKTCSIPQHFVVFDTETFTPDELAAQVEAEATREATKQINKRRSRENRRRLAEIRAVAEEITSQDMRQIFLAYLVEAGGLNRRKLSRDYDRHTISELASKRVGLVTNNGPLALDEVATDFGFTYDDDLMTILLATPTKKEQTAKYINDMLDYDSQYEDKLEDYWQQELDSLTMKIRGKLGKPQVLRLWSAVYHRRDKGRATATVQRSSGFDPYSLAEFILDKVRQQSTLFIFAANVWFDLRVSNLMQILQGCGYDVTSFFSNGRSFQLKMRNCTSKLKILNVQNFWPCSVAEIGKEVNLEKLEVNFKTSTDAELLAYCQRDTEIIYQGMLYWFDFVVDHDMGRFGITLPSQAFNAYRHKYMDYKIGIHTHEEALALERFAYYGGRNECFYIGQLNRSMVYALDINSMYSFVMRDNDFPHFLKTYTEKNALRIVPEILAEYAVVAECIISTNEAAYAVKHDGKTMFPVGEFQTGLCTGSFKYAYERGHIKKILRLAVYSKAPIFYRWVVDMYSLREGFLKAGNATFAKITKRLLNSLYGKFAQKMDKILLQGNTKDYQYKSELMLEHDSGKWCQYIQMGNYFKQVRLKSEESFNSFPAISAHVTDYARMYLWSLIQTAGQENVYYCDTDSLYTNKTGLDRLLPFMNKTRLGHFKLEKKASSMVIHGCKDYIFGSERVIKGVPKNAPEIQSGVFECTQFPGVKSELRGGMQENYSIQTVQKILKREYDKGNITDSGRVLPLVFPP